MIKLYIKLIHFYMYKFHSITIIISLSTASIASLLYKTMSMFSRLKIFCYQLTNRFSFAYTEDMKQLLPILFFLGLFVSRALLASAQSASGFVTYVDIEDSQVQAGDIIKFDENGYKKTAVPYESSIFGVVVEDPAVSLETDVEGTYPVVSSGKVRIRVTTFNGPIKTGDLLTSSQTPGVAQKASQTGYVIGTALEDYESTNVNQVGSVLAQLNIGFGSIAGAGGGNLVQTIREGLSAPVVTPLNALRYLLAILMVILSFFLGIYHFGRIARTGIEAIGRNPMASKLITINILINIILGIGLIFAGLTVAYFILVF